MQDTDLFQYSDVLFTCEPQTGLSTADVVLHPLTREQPLTLTLYLHLQ